MAEIAGVHVRPLLRDEVDVVGRSLGLARLHQGDGFYLVAWTGGAPVGHVHLALRDPPELQDVFVVEEHRRRGIAVAMTTAAEREVRTRGFDRLRLGVSIDDVGAQALYRRCGFVETDVPPNRVHGTIVIRTGPIEVDDTILTWEKPLAPEA